MCHSAGTVFVCAFYASCLDVFRSHHPTHSRYKKSILAGPSFDTRGTEQSPDRSHVGVGTYSSTQGAMNLKAAFGDEIIADIPATVAVHTGLAYKE